MGYEDRTSFESLVGKTLTEVVNKGDEIIFRTKEGQDYRMFHSQNCCESVRVEDIAGDLEDLVGDPIIRASEESSEVKPEEREYLDSGTWTFYNISTIKASVTIRWIGESNGYYSESVDFEKISKDE